MQDIFWVQDPAPVLHMAGQPSAAFRGGCARVSAKGPCRDATHHPPRSPLNRPMPKKEQRTVCIILV